MLPWFFIKKDCVPSSPGFTLIELVVSVGIFAILVAGMLGTFSALSKVTKVSREKTILSNLAANYMEIVRNMPYSQVGTLSGNPHGTLPDFTNAYQQKIEEYNYKIYYEVTYIDDTADGTILAGTDSAPDDYKQVKMNVLNANTGQVTSFFTTVVPKGLEGTVSAGALLFKVFNASGQPIAGATIHITYPTTTPTIILDRTTDSAGQWIEVGLPPAVNNYHVVVTKSGYSTDQTYEVTAANPNPIKPDPTIVVGQVTQVSFSIDTLSNLNIKTLSEICGPINGVNVNVSGAKLIGSTPNVPKYNQNLSSSAGVIPLNSIEWDTFTPILLTGQSWIIKGTSPIQSIDVLPGTNQTYTMILTTNTTANSLLVIVKDAASNTALEGANVTLQKVTGTSTTSTLITGGSVWIQNDWSGGNGTAAWSTSTPARYYTDDGRVDTLTAPTGLRLKKVGASYLTSGNLESSTFDSGTSATNYTTLSWQPTSQSTSTSVSFQIAANNDNATWNYIGPDGTAGTYFTNSGTDVGPALDNNRYVRYKAYLATTDTTKTPVLTSVSLNFVTGCFTPGQVLFTGLSLPASYNLSVSLTGYQTQTLSGIGVTGNKTQEFDLSP